MIILLKQPLLLETANKEVVKLELLYPGSSSLAFGSCCGFAVQVTCLQSLDLEDSLEEEEEPDWRWV